MSYYIERSIPHLILCYFCKHMRFRTGSCKAFPDGIPASISPRLYDHRCSHSEDQNIQFEKHDNLKELDI